MKHLVRSMIVILALAVPATAATKTSVTKATKTTKTMKVTKAKVRVANDATRLAAILSDVQHSARFESAVWKTTVNEANTLANRVYANTGGRAQAKELRTHVREMRKAALNDDAEGARQHAREALPFAYQIIDWASPNQ